jgi:hypothetical protein
MDVQQIMEAAKKRSEEIRNYEGDWRTQLEQLGRVVAEVNAWQEKMERVFGAPRRQSLFEFTEPRLQPAFNGVMIQQQLNTKQSDEIAEVFYQADLHVDENYVLSSMLPQIARHDPVYRLYEIRIAVPRGELIKESLHLINEKLRDKIGEPNNAM